MTTRRRPRARGFVLVELLIAIGLLVVFMIIAARLFTAMIRLSQQSAEAETRVARIDSAIRMLRADAWGATEMSVDPGGTLTIGDAQNSVVWHSDEAGAMSRTEKIGGSSPRAQAWPELGGQLRFRVEGPVLVVAGDERSGRAGELRLVSQVRLAGVKP